MRSTTLRFTLFSLFASLSFNAFGYNLLSNGDFEKPGFSFVAAPWPAVDDFRFLNPGANEALADWIVADNGIGQRSFVYHQNRYPVASGNYGLALDEGSSIAASFTATAAGLLNLSLNMTWANGCFCYQPAPLEVLVDGVLVASFVGAGSNYRYSDMSVMYSASFAVEAGAHTFTLSNPQVIGDYREYRIDNVVLAAVSVPPPETLVPEPEIGAMMLLGLGLLGVVRSRKR